MPTSGIARVVGIIRNAWLIVGITLLLCVLIEIFSAIVLHVHDAVVRGRRVYPEAYGSAPWVPDYYREFDASFEVRWEPYTYWRRRPFQGRYINIGHDGNRVTPQPAGAVPGARPAINVFLFGGSALWGTGARDAFTIPAILGNVLRERGISNRVVNFAESGYVSSQEVIACILELRRGNVPDVVIFYDGINDGFSSYQQGVAGRPQSEEHREIEFDLTAKGRTRALTKAFLRYGSSNLASVRLLRAVLERFGLMRPAESLPSPLGPAELTALARDTSAVYWGNMKLVAELGKQYGYRSFFYWQPSTFEKKRLTSFEAVERAKWEEFGRLFVQVSEAVRHQPAALDGATFRDLSGIFADVAAPIYIDFVHPSERGNDLIARQLAADVLAAIGPGCAQPPCVVR
jgi:lysophospholipase L1-like esterase